MFQIRQAFCRTFLNFTCSRCYVRELHRMSFFTDLYNRDSVLRSCYNVSFIIHFICRIILIILCFNKRITFLIDIVNRCVSGFIINSLYRCRHFLFIDGHRNNSLLAFRLTAYFCQTCTFKVYFLCILYFVGIRISHAEYPTHTAKVIYCCSGMLTNVIRRCIRRYA